MLAPAGRIGAIALNTYRESVRARILLGLAGVAFAVSLYSMVVGAYTLTSAPRVVSDLGTASISAFGIVVAVVIGATSLHRELEQKTIFPILARPIARWEYLLGKYLGTMLVLAVFVAADAGVVMSLGGILGGRPPELIVAAVLAVGAIFARAAWTSTAVRTFGPIPLALVLLVIGAIACDAAPLERRFVLASSALALFEIGIVAALATLFSSFSSPFLSAMLTVMLVVAGRNADVMAKLPVKFFGQALHDLFAQIARVVPNLQLYVAPRPLLTGEAVDADPVRYLLLAGGNALFWSVLLLAAAAVVFRRRDFT